MTIQKFNIETTFSTGKEGYDPERELYERKLEVIRKEAHEAGFKEGHAQALGEIEARAQETLGAIHTALTQLFANRLEFERNIELEAIQMAHLTGKKLAATLIAKYPTQEIEELIKECLQSGYEEPKIVIRSSQELLQSLQEKIQEMAQNSGFQGELALIADPNLSNHDCSVEWPNGGASRNVKELEAQILNKIENYIGAPVDQIVASSIEEHLAKENSTQAIENEVETTEQIETADADVITTETSEIETSETEISETETKDFEQD